MLYFDPSHLSPQGAAQFRAPLRAALTATARDRPLFDDDTRVAFVLWAAHAHVADAFESTPRLALLSPEPGSGKTRAQEVLELLVPRPRVEQRR